MKIMFHVNYRFVVLTIAFIAVIGKIHEMANSFDMIVNPTGTLIKIIGVIALVILLMDDNLLQSEDR